MNKILVLLLSGLLVTGCASSMQTAQQDCQKAGFTPGTELYLKCLTNQNKPGFLEQYMLKRAANPGYNYSTTTNCMRTGNMVQCNSY